MSKLTRENKIEIFERRKNGETIPSLAKAFDVQESNIKYLIALIEKHGYDILRKDKNRAYSKDFKLQIINRILINHESINFVALDIGLVSPGILHNWLSKFKENGYNVVEKKKGRKPKSMTKLKKNDKTFFLGSVHNSLFSFKIFNLEFNKSISARTTSSSLLRFSFI